MPGFGYNDEQKLTDSAGTVINPSTEEKQADQITLLTSLDGKDYATETTLSTRATEVTLATVAKESGGNLDTIAGDTTSIDSKVSTESKQDDIIENQTNGAQKTQIVDSGGEAATVTDNRLDTNVAGIVSIDQPVSEFVTFSTSTNKTLHTVAANKQLKITSCWATNVEGKMQIEFQEDGSGFFSVGLNEQGGVFGQISVDPQTPFGPFPATTVIRASRIDGDTGKDWSAGLTGYLEDV